MAAPRLMRLPDDFEAEKHVELGPGQEDFSTYLRKESIETVIGIAKKQFITVTVNEVAEMLRVNVQTVYRMVERGDLPRVEGIRHVRIPLWRVAEMIRGPGEA